MKRIEQRKVCSDRAERPAAASPARSRSARMHRHRPSSEHGVVFVAMKLEHVEASSARHSVDEFARGFDKHSDQRRAAADRRADFASARSRSIERGLGA